MKFTLPNVEKMSKYLPLVISLVCCLFWASMVSFQTNKSEASEGTVEEMKYAVPTVKIPTVPSRKPILDKDLTNLKSSIHDLENRLRKTEIEKLYFQTGTKMTRSDVEFVYNQAKKQKIPPEIVIEMYRKESSFNSNAQGPKIPRKVNGVVVRHVRAQGVAQIMPDDTGPWLADMAGVSWQPEKLFNVKYATILSTQYLHYLYYGGENFKGYQDWHKVLTAYNRGMNGLKSFIKQTGTAVSTYSDTILDKALVSVNTNQTSVPNA